LLNHLQLLDSAALTQGDSFMKSSIALLAAMLCTAALAQQPSQRSPTAPTNAQPPATTEAAQQTNQSAEVGAVFDKLNTSHDGKLTRQQAEVHPTVAANFDTVDTNHDGVISREEFMAAFQPKR
jgi:hypothetical protein